METGFLFIMHEHTVNTTFTDKFNYYSNTFQKNILQSNRVPSPCLVEFSLMVSLDLKIQVLHVLQSLAYTQHNKYPKISSLIVAKRCWKEKDTFVAIPSQSSSPESSEARWNFPLLNSTATPS